MDLKVLEHATVFCHYSLFIGCKKNAFQNSLEDLC